MTGLVLEGGARRCLFTAGILDEFQQAGLRFDYVAGVSAGAQAALDFCAGQPGRTKAVMLPHRPTAEEILPLRHQVVNELDAMVLKAPYGEHPFDFGAFFGSDIPCEIVATCCETGEPAYFDERHDESRLLTALKASCSVPLLFSEVEIDGRHYVDGSVSDPFPVQRAFSRGCDRVIVILTKVPGEEPMEYSRFQALLSVRYEHRYPALYRLLMDRRAAYDAQTASLQQACAEGRALLLQPEQLYARAFDLSHDKLECAYLSGRLTAKNNLPGIIGFLNHSGCGEEGRKHA